MKHLVTFGVLFLAALMSAPACAATAAPAATQASAAPTTLEVRAATAFNSGQFAVALPMLEKLQIEFENQPEKQGPLAEQIKVCQAQIASAAAVNGTNGGPATPPSLSANRKPHDPAKPGELRDMQIKELGNFDYDADKGGNIPADVLALSGMNVRLHGFMIPIDQTENITQFALVPSLFACCYGQPPQVQHTIVCKAPAGKAVSYFPDELSVEGKLTVSEKKEDGFIVSIFQVEVSSVKPQAK